MSTHQTDSVPEEIEGIGGPSFSRTGDDVLKVDPFRCFHGHARIDDFRGTHHY